MAARIADHKHRKRWGFTAKYAVDRLVYFEALANVTAAIAREKQIRSWNRRRKVELVKTFNPDWVDLSTDRR